MDLVEHHRESLETMSVTATATWLDDDQLVAWLAALNDLRLALGSMLGVTEEAEPPVDDADQAEWIAYMYLGALQSELIDLLERDPARPGPRRRRPGAPGSLGRPAGRAPLGRDTTAGRAVSTGPGCPACSRSWARARRLRRW